MKGKVPHYFLSIAAVSALMISSTFFTGGLSVKADSTPFAVVPGTPFEQNWSNTGLITTDDNWAGVPSIIGFRGDDLTMVTGVDPQTVLTDGSGTPVDVIANLANPDTQPSGGVAEFDSMTNPSIALQGSGVADAPHIVVTLNTSGCTAPRTLNITYDVRDIDGSADNAVQPVALHYRIGAAGSYTNEPAGFIADATTSPNATLVTPVSFTLPATLLGQPVVQLRFMTTNAVGSDEWVAIDNLRVVCAVSSAANVSLGGRVTNASGSGIPNARVQVFGGDLSQPLKIQTNPFGYYFFNDLPAGESYVVSVSAKGRTFAQSSQLINLKDDVVNVNFTSDE